MTLPPGWAHAILSDVTESRVEQGEPSRTPVKYIDIGSIDRALKRIDALSTVTAATAPTRARQWVQKGDVLVSMTRPNLNAVAMVSEDLEGSVASTGFDVLRAIGVLPEWIFYRVRTDEFIRDVCQDVQGVVYPAIRPIDVRGHRLPVAPVAEQRRIVEAIESQLSRIDVAVASLERAQANLKAYRTSILKAAVEGRLVPTEAELARAENRGYEPAEVLLKKILADRRRRWEQAEFTRLNESGKTPNDHKWKAKYEDPAPVDRRELTKLPDGWVWLTVDALAFVTKLAGFEYTKFVNYDDSGDLEVIKAENAGREGFRETQFSRIRSETVAHLTRSKVEAGDVLMVFVGAGTGNVARVPAGRRYFLGPNIAMIRVQSPFVSPLYLEHYLRSPLGRELTLQFSKAVAQPSLSMAAIRKIPVAIPPRDEQDRIVAEIEQTFSIEAMIASQVSTAARRATRLRQAVLMWAFEGRLADQNPSDEDAALLLERIRSERTTFDQGKRRRMPNATSAR